MGCKEAIELRTLREEYAKKIQALQDELDQKINEFKMQRQKETKRKHYLLNKMKIIRRSQARYVNNKFIYTPPTVYPKVYENVEYSDDEIEEMLTIVI